MVMVEELRILVVVILSYRYPFLTFFKDIYLVMINMWGIKFNIKLVNL